MKREQMSVVAAAVVAFLAMAAHDNWIGSLVGWVQKKPNTSMSNANQQQAVNPSTPAGGSGQQNAIRPTQN